MPPEAQHSPRLILIAESWQHQLLHEKQYPFIAQSADLSDCKGKLKALSIQSDILNQPIWQEEAKAIKRLLQAAASRVHKLVGRGHARIDEGPHSIVMTLRFGVIDREGGLITPESMLACDERYRLLMLAYSFQPDSGAEAMDEVKVALPEAVVAGLIGGEAQPLNDPEQIVDISKLGELMKEGTVIKAGLLELSAQHLNRWSIGPIG